MQYVFKLNQHSLFVSLAMSFVVFVIINIVLVAASVDFNYLQKVDELCELWWPCDSENVLHRECSGLQLAKHNSKHMEQIHKGIIAFIIGFSLLNE